MYTLTLLFLKWKKDMSFLIFKNLNRISMFVFFSLCNIEFRNIR